MRETAEAVIPDDVAAEFAPVVTRLARDLQRAAADLNEAEARYLVDLYYQLQHFRMASASQVRTATGEPNAFLDFTATAMLALEKNVGKAMEVYTDQQLVSRWAKSQYGIGPVLAAGLIAHIDVRRAPTVGHVWRFAGLDPTLRWDKGTKRPYNARLKTHCWKIGTSFWKFHKRPECIYGHVMAERKRLEVQRNESGACAEAARTTLAERTFKDKKVRAVYESGRLPDGRVHLRAQRYAVKLFLSHWWQVGRESLGLEVPKPYILTKPEHVHMLQPPGWPLHHDA